jgi:hypothetical protein
MSLMRRPSAVDISGFLDASRELPLSYGPPGIVRHGPDAGRFDEQVVRVGRGRADFERSRAAGQRLERRCDAFTIPRPVTGAGSSRARPT